MNKAKNEKIPIPPKMEHLDKDERGLPIPFFAFKDKSGKPYFNVLSENAALICITENICSICGTKFQDGNGYWFVGGPASFYHPLGCFADPPMHKICARYALKVCPYMSMPSYINRIDAKNIPTNKKENTMILPSIDSKPKFFVLANTKSFYHSYKGGSLLMVPSEVKKAEFWKDGKKVSNNEMVKLISEIREEMNL